MKLESKHQHFSPPRDHMTKCNGNHETEKVAFSSDVKSENKCHFISLAECLSREKALESSHQTDGTHGLDNVTNDAECTEALATYVPLPEFELVSGKRDFASAKVVEEMEQPKMIVCFERDEKQVIKDIGIDEGIHSLDTVLLQKDMEESADFLTVFSSNKYTSASDDIHGADDVEFSVQNRNPFLVDAGEIILRHPCGGFDPDISVAVDQDLDPPTNKVSGIILADQVLGSDSAEVHSPDTDHIKEGTMLTATDITERENCGSSGLDLPNQEPLEPEHSSTLAMEPTGEPVHVDARVDSSSVDKQNICPVPSGDVNMPSVISGKVVEGATGVQHHNNPITGETSSSNIPTSRNPFLHNGHPEDSVFGPHALSDRMTYSGQATYSGSVSVRSDSSTTSTRSFAFPVLQTEWNSSPVKMAKADRRHYRKYRGWRSRLLCCRF